MRNDFRLRSLQIEKIKDNLIGTITSTAHDRKMEKDNRQAKKNGSAFAELEGKMSPEGFRTILFLLLMETDLAFRNTVYSVIRSTPSSRLENAPLSLENICNLLFPGPKMVETLNRLRSDKEFQKGFRSIEGRIVLTQEFKDMILGIGPDIKVESKFCDLVEPTITFNDVILPTSTKTAIRESMEGFRDFRNKVQRRSFSGSITGLMPVIMFEGMPGTGKTITAYALAKSLGLQIAKLKNLDALGGEPNSPSLTQIIQQLNKSECVILIDDFDKFLTENSGLTTADLLTALESTLNPIILTSNSKRLIGNRYPVLRRITRTFLFPIPCHEERKKMWRMHLPDGCTFESENDLEKLARLFLLPGGNIKNIMTNAALQFDAPKKLSYAMLVDLAVDELNKICFPVSGLVRIYSGQRKHVEPGILQQLTPLKKIISKSDILLDELPEPLLLGIYSDYNPEISAINLATLLDQPVVLQYIPEKDFFDHEEVALAKTIVRSLPANEYQTVFSIDETEMAAYLKMHAKPERINLVHVSNPVFKSIHPAFQFCLRVKKNAEAPDGGGFLKEMQEFCDFPILEYCPEKHESIFLNSLRFLWILEGGRRLTRKDAEFVLQNHGGNPNKSAEPLFGQAPADAGSQLRCDSQCS